MSAGLSRVDVRGLDAVQRAMAQLEPGPLKKLLQKTSSAAAKTIKPYVKAETPLGATGKMRRSVSAMQARKDRPAAIVKFRTPMAYYRHMVIGGTRGHRIRFPDQKAKGVPKREGNIVHPGADANPVIERAWSSGRTATLAAIDKTVNDYLEALE